MRVRGRPLEKTVLETFERVLLAWMMMKLLQLQLLLRMLLLRWRLLLLLGRLIVPEIDHGSIDTGYIISPN